MWCTTFCCDYWQTTHLLVLFILSGIWRSSKCPYKPWRLEKLSLADVAICNVLFHFLEIFWKFYLHNYLVIYIALHRVDTDHACKNFSRLEKQFRRYLRCQAMLFQLGALCNVQRAWPIHRRFAILFLLEICFSDMESWTFYEKGWFIGFFKSL